jgi:hypothetical protein
LSGDARLAELYRRFARVEARGRSPLYEQCALAVADDPAVQAVLARLPPDRQQPNLLFAAVAFLAGVQWEYQAFRRVVLDRADELTAIMRARRTQTNEVGRCAVLLPLLASLPQPLALLEVGASAGLCLLPDRYAYQYGTTRVGDPAAPVQIRCEARGPVPIPDQVPEVVWRRGIDLEPVDLRDAASVRWLECCIWPEQTERLARLRAAIQVARDEPPTVIRGNLLDLVGEVARAAPPEATLVIFHSAVLAYLSRDERRRFADLVQGLPATWVSNEAIGIVESMSVPGQQHEHPEPGRFVVGVDGTRTVAFAEAHGGWLEWL